MAISVYHLLWIVSLGIFFSVEVQTAVNKIDFVVQQISPVLVDLDGKVEKPYRGFVTVDYKDTTTFNIGRVIDTGPGDRGTVLTDPDDGLIIDNDAFPSGSTVSYRMDAKYDQISANLGGSNEGDERIGAFYAEAVHDGNTVQITTIIRPAQATITSLADTITASIGDSVVLQVTPDLSTPVESLRWRHNEEFNRDWDGMATVTITNVRKADAGIYECHRDGRRKDGTHAIMRLIVRACPKGKYGADCSENCPTCYNGGMCEDETGVCICPTGFRGDQCETSCGVNAFGATCSVGCTAQPIHCGKKVFCVPDPVGCSCTAGYMGESCETECSGLSYGANCALTCHCGAGACDNAKGCGSSATCDTGYGGTGCQVPTSCPADSFGELCDLQCHCKNYDTCAPACTDYQCADGWGGNDCQQALPALYEFNTQVEVGETSLSIQWNAWDENIDYGTGPAEKYRLYLAPQGQSLEMVQEGTDTGADVTGLQYDTVYEYGVRILRTIKKEYEGNLGPLETSATPCGVPTQAPTITTITVEGPHSIQLEWTTPEGNDWLKCSSITAFIITDRTGIETRIDDGTAKNTSISSLTPCTEYQFYIRVANKNHDGPQSSPSESATTGPNEIQDLTITPISSESLEVTWEAPLNCEHVTDYIVSHQLTRLDKCRTVQEPPTERRQYGTSISIPGLIAHSTYKVVVYARITDIPGEQQEGNGTTGEIEPTGPPDNVTHTVNQTKPTITYDWLPPVCGLRGGDITKYEYAFGLDIEGGDVQYNTTDPDDPMMVFDHLDYYKEYQFQVRASTSPGAGPYSEITKVTTPESCPGAAPINIESDNQDVKGQLRFTWSPPPEDDRNGVIVLYEYEFDIKSDAKPTEWFRNGSTSDTFAIFEGLPHYTEFQFRVNALTSVGSGPFSEYVNVKTLPSEPTMPLDLSVIRNFTSEIELQWTIPEELNGVLEKYVITGIDGDDVKESNILENLGGDIVTANLTELDANTNYAISVCAVTNGGTGPKSNEVFGKTLEDDSTDPPEPNIALAVGLSFTFVFLLVFILLAVVLWKRREPVQKRNSSIPDVSIAKTVSPVASTNEALVDDDEPDKVDVKPKPRAVVSPVIPLVTYPSNKPVLLEDFIDYVKSKRCDAPDHELSFDYKALPTNSQGPMTVSKKKENATKNRYINIIAYDHSRVVLEPLEGKPHSDYINASYIDGYNGQKYIAAQGPNSQTVNDMWRMIWQENTHTIIMATKCIEGPKKKCEQYWPKLGESLKYGAIIVTNNQEEERNNYTIRTFTVTDDENGTNNREVKQFHFTGWPDMQAPEFAGPVLQLLEEVNGYNPPNVGHMVVHCSAGVGRTGTFITIDSMLKMVKSEGKLDIFNFVMAMRANRVMMIQTEPQYEFIHDALLEALFCQGTTIENADMEQQWSKVKKDDKWFDDQHRSLEAMFPVDSEERCAGGHNSENVDKNRFQEHIPPDSSRPYLMSTSESGGNNYVNATFCNGYKKDNLYIMTQVPLPNTVTDFWCMVYDYKCYSIVALNDRRTQDKTRGNYIPDEGSVTFGGFTVQVTSKVDIDNVTRRKLKLKKNGSKDSLSVTQVQYNEWTGEQELPKSSTSFLQLLQHVEEARRESRDNRMTVMCMDGVSRCSLLCAVISIVDKIKEEQQVDVYQSVKRLRKARYNMVKTKAQYKFCYEMAREYLRGFETYSNFSNV